MVFTYGVHRSPLYWNKPLDFMPERFLVETEETQLVDGVQNFEGGVNNAKSRAPVFFPFLQVKYFISGLTGKGTTHVHWSTFSSFRSQAGFRNAI